jgi:hypothetical protein
MPAQQQVESGVGGVALGPRHYSFIFDQQRDRHQERQPTLSLKGRSKQPPRGACIAADRRHHDMQYCKLVS